MPEFQPLAVRFQGFTLDESNARLALHGEPVDLPPKAFAVLCALVRNEGRLVAKNTLLDAVWGHRHVSESLLKTTISQVRVALADDAKRPQFIETAARRGYRFIAPLQALGSAPAADAQAAPSAEWLVPIGSSAIAIEPASRDDALIGRDREVAYLASRMYIASAGKPQIVLVAGEPGIGKTTLIERFVASQTSSGAALTIASGQCIEHFGAGEAYMPVLEALNLLCRGDTEGRLVALMRKVAPSWLVHLPWFVTDTDRQLLQREVAGSTQDRMLREFGELLDRFAHDRPLLLVLEDLHWSDHATIQLIGYLARRKGTARLMVVGSFRPTEIIVTDHPLKSMRQELRLHRLCDELDLEAFSESDVGRYLERRFGHTFDEPFVRALHLHTEGLPLFVVNVVDELIAEGQLSRDGNGWTMPDAASLGIPASIAGIIERQIARLDDDERQWLIAASVVGTEFVHTHVADALDFDPARLQHGFDAIARRGDWLRGVSAIALHDGRVGSRYAFRHAVYRHVFYQQAGAAQRVDLHRRVAQALIRCYCAGTGEIATELAMHFERGNDLPRAIGYLQMAAEKALGRFATHEAVDAAQRGLRLLGTLPDADQRLDLELELRVLEGVALAQTRMYSEPEVAAAFERAQALCDALPESPARARALHGLWWVNLGRGEMERALALARRIAALGTSTGDPNLQIIGAIALGSTLTHIGALVEAQAHLDSGYAIFERDGGRLNATLFIQDPGVELLCYRALVQWWRGEPNRSRDAMAAALARADEIRHTLTTLMALHFAGVLHLLDARYDAALETSGRAIRIIGDHGLVGGGPTAHSWTHGCALTALGDPETGLATMRRGAAFCRERGMLLGMSGYHFLYAEVCCLARRLAEAEESVDAGLAFAEAGGERVLVAPMYRIKATLMMARGDHAGAETTLEQALAMSRKQGARCFELGALLTWSRLPHVSMSDAARELRRALDAYGEGETVMTRAAHSMIASS